VYGCGCQESERRGKRFDVLTCTHPSDTS
jgi:hypothetical protein